MAEETYENGEIREVRSAACKKNCGRYRIYPDIESLWRDKKTQTVYSVRSVDRIRGTVFLKTLVVGAFCRLPLKKFYKRFERCPKRGES